MTATKAMLDCTLCQGRKNQDLQDDQVRALHTTGACQLYCEKCNRHTMWSYAVYDRRAGRDRRTIPRPLSEEELKQPEIKERAYAMVAVPVEVDAYKDLARAVLGKDGRKKTERREAHNRVAVRVPLEVPVRLRVVEIPQRFEEVTRTSNLCKGGIYIESDKAYHLGLPVLVVLHYADVVLAGQLEQRAVVVRLDQLPFAGAKRGVAFKFE